jgi:hypothetical protein
LSGDLRFLALSGVLAATFSLFTEAVSTDKGAFFLGSKNDVVLFATATFVGAAAATIFVEFDDAFLYGFTGIAKDSCGRSSLLVFDWGIVIIGEGHNRRASTEEKSALSEGVAQRERVVIDPPFIHHDPSRKGS